jgi:signal transduction histidine kinase
VGRFHAGKLAAPRLVIEGRRSDSNRYRGSGDPDPALVRLGISNGVRNAVEAVGEGLSDEPHPIVVAWGETDVDYWVAVIDRGPGIVGLLESAFEIGKTTKKGHSGFELAIARQAVETLGGTSILQPAAGGGAHYEIRWER